MTLPSEQKPKRKPRKQTDDKEMLDNLYKYVDNSGFSGKMSLSNLKLKAENLGLDALGASNEQKPDRKSKWDTTDKQKLEKLYNSTQKSAFTGQKPTYQSLIEKCVFVSLIF